MVHKKSKINLYFRLISAADYFDLFIDFEVATEEKLLYNKNF